jgi:PhoH-like ATPase
MAKSKTTWGIKAKNEEQKEALKHLMNPEIDLVVLSGTAGSGKTLLALAAGLEQILETKMYREIIFTRAPIGVGEDMGFLPGTEEEKMASWCGALFDNLEFLIGSDKLAETIVKTKIKIRAMQFMRGRSFHERWLIIDEAQNITVQQMKVLLTRAGEGCKIVVLGDSSQIDNKKLKQETNALTALLQFRDSVGFVRVVELPAGVRSRLATWSAEVL